MEIEKHVVLIDESALTQILMSSLEAYIIGDEPNGGGKPIETYGLLWGSISIQQEFDWQVAFYHISDVSIDISAVRRPGSVDADLSSLRLKWDVQRAINPVKQFLGDFHSHPYHKNEKHDISQIRSEKLYGFSKADHRSFSRNAEFYKKAGLNVAIVATVFSAKKSMSSINAKVVEKQTNAFEFCLSNYRIWISAYRANFSESGSLSMVDDIEIRCPYILGLQKPQLNFGYYRSEGMHEDYHFDE